ncbi:hypothetical protein PROFUN_01401 [Planoprotostelium fungivorum]|uniref:Secreted protein n=1 Tax=Planoprotostelium fungivorum TaxID=1890364 RepID=A0A2P6NT40_9EUKA|nr:hypothetical protein PROFUN_01401 [Planoprotostelium fungivorum]
MCRFMLMLSSLWSTFLSFSLICYLTPSQAGTKVGLTNLSSVLECCLLIFAVGPTTLEEEGVRYTRIHHSDLDRCTDYNGEREKW